jgi:hypothetical protein
MPGNRRYGGQVGISGQSEKILLTEAAKFMVVARPFFAWPLLILIAVVFRKMWPDNLAVVVFIALVGIGLGMFAHKLTRTRGKLGRTHAAITALVASSWIALADVQGRTSFVMFCAIAVLSLLCFTWSMRAAVRNHTEYDQDHLGGLFAKAGMDGVSMQVHPPKKMPLTMRKNNFLVSWGEKFIPGKTTIAELNAKSKGSAPTVPIEGKRRAPVERRLRATIHLNPGEHTADDMIKKAKQLESAGEFPPGTLTVTHNIDNASLADVIISDPRLIRTPIPYPGPSFPHASIAEPLAIGLYQDGTECEVRLTEVQMQVMGMTGSGKSLGGCWSALSEIITRDDVVVWAADITKGDQTLGPLRGALARIETSTQGAKEMLADVNAIIKPRTNYLASKGLGKWRKGCGLQYMVIWLEEAPDIIESLGEHGEEMWIRSVKAARSAGITFVVSLQRADFTQMPTIARGQMAKWCFGVADTHEASFGLSDVQSSHDCEPELWGSRQPGMSYIDAPSIPDERLSMPMRTWFFGEDSDLISAHAAHFPARVELDQTTAAALGNGATSNVPAEDEDDVVTQYAGSEDDDDMKVDDAELDQEIVADTEPDQVFQFANTAPAETVEPVKARLTVRDWIVSKPGERFSASDLVELRKSVGYGRAWIYKVLTEFEASGLVEREDSRDGVTWLVTTRHVILSQAV